MQQQNLSRLMRMSWEIQKRRKISRSRSLFAAWAIYQNEDITVFHLVKKHSHEKYANKLQTEHLTLAELKDQKHLRRFPFNTDAELITRRKGRINHSRQISFSFSGNDQSSYIIELNIPDFINNIEQIITRPRILNQNTESLYSNCQFNDHSNKLRQFLKLFENEFSFVEEFIYDKFWSDLFYQLTDNSKVEGDTISFAEILQSCVAVLTTIGGILGPCEQTRTNEDNLKLGMNNTLQELMEHNIFIPGFIIKCKSCSSKIWYSLLEIDNKVLCKGCSEQNAFKAEIPISYKLNHLIKNNIGMKSDKGIFVPDGNLTVIKTLIHLWHEGFNEFYYSPQLNIFKHHELPKPVTDLDIICLVRGLLYIGEAKHSSPLFFENSNKSLDNLLAIASTVKPDYLLLSCSVNENNKLEKAAQYLRHHISKWELQPTVKTYVCREPDYFNIKGYRYFYY